MKSGASLYEAVSIAIASLRAAKLRSFLTLLGIILSTATLIAVMSVIHGMDVYVAEKVTSMGVDGFTVVRMAFLGNFDPKKFMELLKKNPELTEEEFHFVREKATLVQELALRTGRAGSVGYANRRLEDIRITGGTSNLNVLNNLQVNQGRYFSAAEDRNRRMVAFIGADLKDEFFPSVDPIGKFIEIDGRPFEVVGIAKRIGSVFGESQDSFVHIPVETFFKMYGKRRSISYVARALSRDHLERAMDEVRSLIRAFRRLPAGREDNFMIVASDSILEVWDRLTGAIAATAVAVVSVFMVVGGVVIMNIMLAVVTERTMEIGIRKSLGARRTDILQQFLVESSVLAATGGLIGVLLAWSAAVIVRNATPVPMSVPASAVIVGVGLSAIVGLFFGIYPAAKASKLDPIQALRYEK